jgi:hypothetical protein
MSAEQIATLAERKAQLVTRAHVDRARMTLAMLEIRTLVSPPASAARRASVRPTAARLIGIALPLLGMARVTRLLRIASFALAAYRVARNWRSAH